VALRKLNVGKALVDGQGRTLYVFEADKGTSSTCNAACASVWPPATTAGRPTAGPGVDAAKLGTTKRGDGALEVTYDGHPLYRYAPDAKPGDAAGQGLNQFGAPWYVLAASGKKIDNG
jgi:predicted lipoprotein with Yx(FWY)xxD motif